MRFEKIPIDVRRHIMAYCTPGALLTLASTCQAYRALLTTPVCLKAPTKVAYEGDPYFEHAYPGIYQQQNSHPMYSLQNNPIVSNASNSAVEVEEANPKPTGDATLRNDLWRRLFRRHFPCDYPNMPVHSSAGSFFPRHVPTPIAPEKEREEKLCLSYEEWRAEEEERITAFCRTRDWFQFFVEATIILRRNTKCYTVMRSCYDSPISRPTSKPAGLPPSLAQLSDYQLLHRSEAKFVWRPQPRIYVDPSKMEMPSSAIRGQLPIPTLLLNPIPQPVPIQPRIVQPARGGPPILNPNPYPNPIPNPNGFPQYYPHHQPYPVKCGPPPMPCQCYDDALVSEAEVGEFFEVSKDGGESGSVDFSKPENNIHYKNAK
jgi:hypothetical protein